MRQFITIHYNGTITPKPASFFLRLLQQRVPVAVKATTWLEAIYEVYPQLSMSEVQRRITNGALNVGEPLDLQEAKENIGLKSQGDKGFDAQVVKFGKERVVIVTSVELREYLAAGGRR